MQLASYLFKQIARIRTEDKQEEISQPCKLKEKKKNISKNLHKNKYLIKSFCTHLLYILCFALSHSWLPSHLSVTWGPSRSLHYMIGLHKVFFFFFRLNETKPWSDEFWKTRFTVTQITDSIKTNVNRLKCVEFGIVLHKSWKITLLKYYLSRMEKKLKKKN